ncbi:hypothetical protein BMETH_2975_0 [methanotrophic bacterial endosymbiont of Bathymodiolus sp.]|nr:hypothetical protein BMETH_2975_0 [methanotrophic bacterial endosymbiont of Bathymodiolus sp.]
MPLLMKMTNLLTINPVTKSINLAYAIELCIFWCSMISSNFFCKNAH